MQAKIAPSILAADFSGMGRAVTDCEKWGADLIHCDVMDGTFVPPITFGGQMIKNIRPHTRLPLDCHLMTEHPQSQIKPFADAGADYITVHYGACAKISPSYLKDTLLMIKAAGVKCGAAVNPDEDAEKIFDVFPLCDMVVLMSVFPGYGGQKFIPEVMEKIKKARTYARSIGRADMDIEIDGGVTAANAAAIRKAGANVLVAGTALFKADDPFAVAAEIKGL